MKKKIILGSIAGIVCVIFVAVMIYFFGDSYPDFYKLATKEFNIPGLETSFVPQGMDYDEDAHRFLIGGYMNDGQPSRIYFVDKISGKTEKYLTLTIDGEAYTGHCGGVAIDGDYGWVVGDKQVYRFSYADAINTENSQSLEVIDGFTPGNGADFVLVNGNKLIVGEFYKQGKYDTPTAHHIKFSNEINYALSYIYTIDQSKDYGISSTTPEAGISMPNQVQGMTFTKDKNIVLSTSYSIPASKIMVYENALTSSPTQTITLNNNTLPVYVLNSENHIKTISAPPMSEEIVLVDNKVYTLFESDCSKYRLINREKLSNVYALDI